MAKKILIVQLRSQAYAEHEKVCFARNAAKYYPEMEFVNVLTEGDKLPKAIGDLQNYSCVLIVGTGEYDISQDLDKPEVQRLITLQKLITDTDFPYLGMCLGHQILGYVLGSAVEKDENQKEVGTVKITLTDEGKKDKIFGHLKPFFEVNEGHKDSIMKVPTNTALLASSNRCLVQAIRYKDNQYGAQFHAELDKRETLERFELYLWLNPETNYASNIEELKAKTKETPDAKRIFDAFFSHYHSNSKL